MKKVISIFLFVSILTGCATYTKDGAFGGFRETPLSQDTYRIHASGNALTSRSRTNAIALVRAAELAKENGFERFIIMDIDEWNAYSYYTTPTRVRENTQFSGSLSGYSNIYCSQGSGNFGFSSQNCHGYGSASMFGSSNRTVSISPGQTNRYEHPRLDVVVRFVSESSPDFDRALSVTAVIEKYGPDAGLSQQRMAELKGIPRSTFPEHFPMTEHNGKGQPGESVSPYISFSVEEPKSLDEIYHALPPEDRKYVDEMSFLDRLVYLRSQRRD